MGIVADSLMQKAAELVERRGVLVWFDPERQYQQLIDQIQLPGTKVVQWSAENGFFALRRELEADWRADEPPKLLLYLPLAEEACAHALAEYTSVGAVLAPGRQPPEWNTRLAVVVKRALSGISSEGAIETIVAEVEAGKLDLAEVDRLVEGMVDINLGALKLIFNLATPEEILLRFLAENTLDAAIQAKNATEDVRLLAKQILTTDFKPTAELSGLRQQIATFIIVHDFLATYPGETPAALAEIPRPSSALTLAVIQRLASHWRHRSDFANSYYAAAMLVEARIPLQDLPATIESLAGSWTFAGGDSALRDLLERQIQDGIQADTARILHERSQGYWAGKEPSRKLRWTLLLAIERLLAEADRVQAAIAGKQPPAYEFIAAYTADEQGWYGLDQAQRRFEHQLALCDIDPSSADQLQRLIAKARRRYREVADLLAREFVKAFEEAKFETPGVGQQSEIFRTYVQPKLSGGRTAYILVDALRFEMGAELISQIGDDWATDLSAALASVPTITEVGMAALLPGAEGGMTIRPGGAGKLQVEINASILRSRQDRIKHLEKSVEGAVVVTELDQIAPLSNQNLRQRLKTADLVILTASDEIDGLWEGNPAQARRLQDDVFAQIRRGIHTLALLEIEQVIISSDHGFIFGEELSQGELIDAPGGEQVDLHRRVWVGKGGAAIEGCLRAPLSAFGLGGELELVTPYGMAFFKTPGGSMQYFHGGMSLPELIIPVIEINLSGSQASAGVEGFDFTARLGSEKITTRFISATIEGKSTMLFEAPPKLRVELRFKNRAISNPVSASYGFDEGSGDVSLAFASEGAKEIQPNTITLQITDASASGEVSLVVLDAESGQVLVRQDGISIDIAL